MPTSTYGIEDSITVKRSREVPRPPEKNSPSHLISPDLEHLNEVSPWQADSIHHPVHISEQSQLGRGREELISYRIRPQTFGHYGTSD